MESKVNSQTQVNQATPQNTETNISRSKDTMKIILSQEFELKGLEMTNMGLVLKIKYKSFNFEFLLFESSEGCVLNQKL